MSDYNSGENQGENADGNTNGNINGNTNVSTNVIENADAGVKKLELSVVLIEGINFCINNIGPILVNFLLWVITIWIPYLNVGTTIGLFAGIVIKLSRGETISFTEIFDPKYRKYMGEYLLTAGFIFLGVFIGAIFLIVPAFIISIAWGFALILVVDKGKNPTEALALSNNITYGNKGRILLINIIASMIFSIIQVILNLFDNYFAIFLLVITVIFQTFVSLGIQASMYKRLAGDIKG
jgi:hypothetical protein